MPDVRQLPVPPVGEHEGEGAEEEGRALPGVHRRLQHPRARPDQVEGKALRGTGQDLDQAGGQVGQEIMKCFRGVGLILFAEIVWMR